MSAAAAPPQYGLLVGRRDRLWPMVAVSLVVHAALIALAAWQRPPAVLDLNQKPIVARLARYGELRPKHYMPRKEASPPPAPAVATPAPPPPPAPTPAPEAAPPAPPKVAEPAPAPKSAGMPPPKAEPVKQQPAQRVAHAAARPAAGGGGGLASALSRVERDQKVYGSPDGDPLGDAEEGEGDPYLALVTRSLQETYTLPATISEAERMHLRATVLLFIEHDGRISRYEFEQRSGNPTFDGALESAVRNARLPPPPAERRERYRKQGLAVLYRP